MKAVRKTQEVEQQRCERRHQERLLTLHQAHGKSIRAISKPRSGAPATFAPHNYNTIWQRYWAHIPCRFCGRSFPASAWFYIKLWRKGINTDLLEGKGMQPGGAGKQCVNVSTLQGPEGPAWSSTATVPLRPKTFMILSDLYLWPRSKSLTGDLPVGAASETAGWITWEKTEKN